MGCGGSTAAEPAAASDKPSPAREQKKAEPQQPAKQESKPEPQKPAAQESPRKTEPEKSPEHEKKDQPQEHGEGGDEEIEDYKKLAQMSIDNIMAGAMSNLDKVNQHEIEGEKSH